MPPRSDNQDDLGFLISRSLDGDLSGEETARLERALTGSADLRSELAEMVAVNQLVKEWGNHPVEIDWSSHHALIEARTDCDAKAESDANLVDNLLADWAVQGNIDGVDLRSRVLDQIRGADRANKSIRWVLRLGLPLAAAAAIAIAVLLPNSNLTPASRSASIVQIGPGDAPVASAVTTVVFERTAMLEVAIPLSGSMELIVVGSPPLDMPLDESAPL